MTVIPIKPLDERDPLDDFNDLFADVKGASEHELQVAIGAVKPAKVTYRSVHPVMRTFPDVSNAEYGKLHDSIRQHGQQRAICLFEGMIWDGRARFAACLDLGIVPRVRILRRECPIVYVLRRHTDRFGLPSTEARRVALVTLNRIEAPDWKAAAAKNRADWINQARVDFQRAWRRAEPCAVCGLASEYSHAHHSLPLSLQYEFGVDEPLQDHDWLCHVHHKLVHRKIAARLIGTRYWEGRDTRSLYGSDDAFLAAGAALDVVLAKAERLFADIGGVAPAGNWRMFQP